MIAGRITIHCGKPKVYIRMELVIHRLLGSCHQSPPGVGWYVFKSEPIHIHACVSLCSLRSPSDKQRLWLRGLT
jgi:hypothetical protein